MEAVRRSPQVDSLRGSAALVVAFLHTMVIGGLLYRSEFARHVVGQMDVAVTIFFCISGYVLYAPLVRSHLDGETPSTRRYAIRRVLRIIPAYWVALTISAVLLGWHYVFTPTGIVSYYGLVYLYGHEPLSAIQPGWTLCVEISFYVFLPIWAWLLRRAPARDHDSIVRLHLWALAALGLLSAVYVLAMLQFGGLGNVNPSGTWQIAALPARLSGFATGMAIAVLAINARDGKQLPRVVRILRDFPWLSILSAAVLFVISTIVVTPDFTTLPNIYGHADIVLRMVLFWGIGALILVPAVFPREGSLVDRVLTAKSLVSLGLVSFGMYLCHWPLLIFFSEHTAFRDHTDNLGLVGWTIAAVIGTIVLGTLSYLIIERPAIDWAHRLAGRGNAKAPRQAGLSRSG